MRRIIFSFLSLAVIAALLFILLRPFGADENSGLWPHIDLAQVDEFNFSGAQNYSLKKTEGSWQLLEADTLSLVDARRLDNLVVAINAVHPLQEMPPVQAVNATKGQVDISADSAFLLPEDETEVEGLFFGPDPAGDNFFSNASQASKGGKKLAQSPLILTVRGEETWTITLKTPEKAEGHLALEVSKNGEKAHTVYVEPFFSKILLRPSRYYAELRLFSGRPERVLGIEVDSAGNESWELAKLSEGTFSFVKPPRFKGVEVPQAGMEFYLHAILSTQSPGRLFKTLPVKLEEPFLSVKVMQDKSNIATGSKSEQEILTVSRAEGRSDFVGYSSYQGAYFLINAQRLEQLGRALLSLRSRPVLPSGIGQAHKSRLTLWNSKGEAQVREFSRSPAGWNEKDSSADLVGVETIFWRLGTLQTEGKAEHKPPSDLMPVMAWELFYNKEEPLKLTFYASKSDPTTSWVRLGEEGAFYPVISRTITEIFSLLPAPSATN